MQGYKRSIVFALALPLTGFVAACDPSDDASADADEARNRPPRRDTDIAIGEDVQGTFTYDLQRDEYLFTADGGSVISAEITSVGTQRGLDSWIDIYGPADAFGKFPKDPIASDDNTGVGRLSKIAALAIAADGDYRLVVTTKDGRQRGTYRLELLCVSGSCAEPEEVTEETSTDDGSGESSEAGSEG